jgi:hypothetical protein
MCVTDAKREGPATHPQLYNLLRYPSCRYLGAAGTFLWSAPFLRPVQINVESKQVGTDHVFFVPKQHENRHDFLRRSPPANTAPTLPH